MGYPAQMTQDQILRDIETLYRLTLKDGNWHTALCAKELQGKAIGLFKQSHLPNIVRISDITEEQLYEFVDRLKKNEPDLKHIALSEIEINERKEI